MGLLQLYYIPIDSTGTQDDSSCVESNKAVRVSKLWSLKYIAIWCVTYLTKLTLLMTVPYAPNDGFTANDASFYKNKVGYMSCCSS